MKMSVTTEEMSGGPGGSTGTAPAANGGSPPAPAGSAVRTTMTEDVVKCGYLRKLKGKKKFFVLHRETETGGQARLEYYANERKFRLGHLPKKTIILRHCFNINRTDSKCKFAIALHTHNDCVRIAMNSEEELTEWLRLLNLYAGDEEDGHEELLALGTAQQPVPSLKPHFEHVWLVTALNKGLGSKENIIGPYRLCLTSKELTLLKVGDYDEKTSMIKFPLNVIRSVSHDTTFGCFFHIEFGRLAVTGPGQLSLKTEDNNIAQNMHLLILKAMQNYSKEDLLPRDGVTRRGRTYTWNSESGGRPGSFHGQTPPIANRLNSVDHGTMRIRTESMGSCGGGSTGMSPPMPIHTPPPSFSPLCSTTDSASSSYSVDYENNNGANQARLMSSLMSMMELGSSAVSGTGLYSKSVGDDDEDEPYVPFNPLSQQPSSLTLSIHHPHDTSDYVETTVGSAGTALPSSATSNYMDMQSPLENYMPMSPAGSAQTSSNGKSSNGYNGKLSSFHSRNSSLVEELGVMPGNHSRRCDSEASETGGSTAGLDDAYLDMDFNTKLNLSNEDMRRMSPASTESLQSGTPSYPLEKVSSYLLPSDDLEDEPRPVRAYSVGSRSDTGASKGRFGKSGRLEAVQETFRLRAASVGARTNPRAKPSPGLFSPTAAHPPSMQGSSSSVSSVALSSSWSGSGSTGRWPLPRGDISPAVSGMSSHSRQNSDTVDSDLMELDFSHNRDKARKRSLGSSGAGLMTPTGSSLSKSIESPDNAPYMHMTPSSSAAPYVASAPISISQKKDVSSMHLTGLDLKKEDGYLEMDFPSQKPEPVVVVRPSDNVVPALFTLNGTHEPVSSLSSLSPWTLSPKPDSLNLSTSPANTSAGISPCLSRIEESPEKQEPRRQLGQPAAVPSTADSGAPTSSVTYTTIEHLSPAGKRSPGSSSALPLLSKNSGGVSCGISKYPTVTSVTYSQIDFKKSPSEPLKNN